jgi:hypothetical protein
MKIWEGCCRGIVAAGSTTLFHLMVESNQLTWQIPHPATMVWPRGGVRDDMEGCTNKENGQ